MKYPALWAALFAGAGVVLADVEWLSISIVWGGLLLLSISFFVLGFHARVTRIPNPSPLYFLFAATLSVFASSALYSLAVSSSNPRDISRWADERGILPATITGRLRRLVIGFSGSRKFEIDVSMLETAAVRLKAEGRVFYEIKDGASIGSGKNPVGLARSFHSGDEVCLTGSLSALPARRNSADFDTKTYYQRLGYSAVIEQPPGGRLAGKVPGSVCDGLVLVRHNHGGVAYLIERIRTAIRGHMLSTHRSSAAHQLLPALLLGDRSLVLYSSREAFRSSGLSHLLAISGLHVGILGMTLYWILGIGLGKLPFSYLHRQAIRASATFLALLIFAAISGGSPSVQRAVTMTSVFLLGTAVGRPAVGWNGLGVAGLVVIGLMPHAVLSVGFQLSFSAVAGIFLWLNPESLLPSVESGSSLRRSAVKTIEISAAIFCSTLPVMFFHFGVAPLIGLLLNVLAIPLTALLLFSSVLSTTIGASIAVLGPSLATTTDLLATALNHIALLFSGTGDHARITSATGTLSAFHFIPLAVLWMIKSRQPTNAVWKFFACALLAVTFDRSDSRPVSFRFLDVGQGDSAVVLTPSGKTIVIDTGGGGSSARALARHLSSIGSRAIEMLVITHFHRDHSGGLSYLLEEYDVGTLIISDGATGSVTGAAMSQLLADTPVREVHRGDVLSVDSSVRLYVLAPREEAFSSRSTNELSVVLRLTYGNTSFLLTGDAESNAETAVVVSYGMTLNSDVIKVAHHGSSTSSGLPFVLRSSDKKTFSVVSVGRNNRFDHPNRSVVQRWQKAGSEVLLTSAEGEIRFVSDGITVSRIDWR